MLLLSILLISSVCVLWFVKAGESIPSTICSPHDENASMWFYTDPQGKVQGTSSVPILGVHLDVCSVWTFPSRLVFCDVPCL